VALDCLGGLPVRRGFVPSMDEAGQDAHVHRGGQAADEQGAALSDASKLDGIGPGTLFNSARQAPGATVPEDENGCLLKPMPERLVMEPTAQLPDHHKTGEMATEAKHLPRRHSRQDLAGKGRARPGLPCPIRPKGPTFPTSSLATCRTVEDSRYIGLSSDETGVAMQTSPFMHQKISGSARIGLL